MWHEMMLEDGQGQLTLAYILREMGTRGRILSREEIRSEYILYARLRGRVNTGSLLPRTGSAYSCHPCIIINNALFLSGKSLDIDEKLYSKFKQRGKP